MFPQFQRAISEAITAGAVFGTPNQPIYNPEQPTSKDSYAPGDARNLFGSSESDTKGKQKRKKNLPKTFPKVIKRQFPETILK